MIRSISFLFLFPKGLCPLEPPADFNLIISFYLVSGYPDYDPNRALMGGAMPPGFPQYYPHPMAQAHPYASAHHSLFAAEAARMAEVHRAAVESQHRAALAAAAAEQKDLMSRSSGNTRLVPHPLLLPIG